ncbi:hypothetical protein A5765_19335 [Mycolicibacterium celeriflavum]|uniref:hypothetical protein n=1 Tax=Mycolicibacterium celeriflavum TaxID=1249101 RepID=UPI000801F33E|nr:hypothetical protein [Mycolicibacterium celeriflavum]OBG22916.1 hypothetical protein A5765_19335 [Mycolicibacterium celeriflavum]
MKTCTVSRRRAAAAGLVTTVLVAGCGGDPNMDSSNRGAGSETETTSVENAFIVPRFIPGSCAIQIGDAAALTFTVTNNRITEQERLLGIDTPAAEAIRLSPDATLQIPPETTIAAGQPIEDVGDGAVDRPFTASVEGLRETAKPGKSVDMTFHFEKQGDLAMKVPIEACPTQK